MIRHLQEKILSGIFIDKKEAEWIANIDQHDFEELFILTNKIRQDFKGNTIELCSIINAKSGACSEDCKYCAQSSISKSDIAVYPLLNKENILIEARKSKDKGIKRFSIVTSGRKVNEKELTQIGSLINDIRDIGISPCASLGLLTKEELWFLFDKGLERYHHNLETSEGFFKEICSSHTYYEKLETVLSAKSIGLSVCSGGIFGMGEDWQDRIDMAFTLKELDVDSVPINFLVPIDKTPFANKELLNPFEALKIICLFRIILSLKSIRICGGRIPVLGKFSQLMFMAGADSLMTGNYLTTKGMSFEEDIKLVQSCGLLV